MKRNRWGQTVVVGLLLQLFVVSICSHLFLGAQANEIVILDRAAGSNSTSSDSSGSGSGSKSGDLNNSTAPKTDSTVTSAGNKNVTNNQTNSTPNPLYIPFKVPCDMTAERGICLFNGQKVILPDAVRKGSCLHINFDMNRPLDLSRNQNHAAWSIASGPGLGGRGSSGYFDGTTHLYIPPSSCFELMKTSAFSASFWAYFLPPDTPDPENHDCHLVHVSDSDDGLFNVGFNTFTRELSVSYNMGRIKLRSVARVHFSTWTHVAAVVDDKRVTLYVNGVNDRSAPIGTIPAANVTEFSFFGGLYPPQNLTCYQPLFMDELRVFTRALEEDEILAESATSLGGVEGSYIRPGCVAPCTYEEALQLCKEPYHLCFENELYAGAISAAWTNGYIGQNTKLWSNAMKEDGQQPLKQPEGKKSSICCNLM